MTEPNSNLTPPPPGAFFSREAIQSVPWLLVGKVLTFFIYFVISIFIVRGLGPTQYGIYALLTSIAEYLMVFCAMGLNLSLLRFVPELAAEGNRGGLKRFLARSTFVQSLAWIVVSAGLFLFSPMLSRIFHFSFEPYLVPLLLFTGMLLTKEFVNNLFTSLFLARFLAITSVGQALLFIGWLAWLSSTQSYSVNAVLLAYSVSIGAMGLISLVRLQRYFHSWKAPLSKEGIGRRRVLNLTLPTLFNAVTNKLLQQYSEIFFLGYFAAPALVGYYTLGFTLANLLLSFVPLALHTLFTSAFCEAYTRDKNSLGDLTAGVYQVLILVTVPLSCFGFFFAPQVVEIVYGANMGPAGPITSFFCLFQILPMIWIPLSMAITATEKVANTMWLNAVQLVVNLTLDYVFIKQFELEGAMLAILTTYVVTAPLKLWWIRRLLGGIYFPASFFVRILAPSALLAGALYYLAPAPGLLQLGGLAIGYAIGLFAAIKVFRLIWMSDTARFKTIQIRSLNRVLDFLTRSN